MPNAWVSAELYRQMEPDTDSGGIPHINSSNVCFPANSAVVRQVLPKRWQHIVKTDTGRDFSSSLRAMISPFGFAIADLS